jgi:GNAT superfamily N-acetyltransferase
MHSVRLMDIGDVDTLLVLCAEHARFERAHFEVEGKSEGLREALFGVTPRLRAWVAIVQGQAVGYATATEEFSTWNAISFLHMDCLFVRPGHRNGGIGAALLGSVVLYARARALPTVQWQTPSWNVDACRFYERHGAIAHHKVGFRLSSEKPLYAVPNT